MMYYKENELKKLQSIQLSMLKSLSAYCEENDIEFFLIAGTALGAKRHGGFIPWDDDIDIGMTRKNYDRFINKGKQQFIENMFLQLPETDKNSPFGFAKVRLDNSLFVEYSYKKVDMHKGIYIDIFPFDKTSENVEEMQDHFDEVLKWNKLNIYKRVSSITTTPNTFLLKIKQIVRFIVHFAMKMVPSKYIMNKLNKETNKYNSMNTKMYANLYSSIREYICEDDLYPLKKMKFEDFMVNCPQNLDKYLINLYGDYNRFPDEKDRMGHKPTEFNF